MENTEKIPLILVVDDHADIRDLVKRFLEQHGYKANAVQDGPSMKKYLTENAPDLIVLDLMLPGEDGFSLCKGLRQKGCTIPIIMLTAMNEDTDRIIGLELGADDYLTKPFNPRELLARVRAVLRRTQTSSTTNAQQPAEKVIHFYHFNSWTLDIQKRELTDSNGILISLSTAEYDLITTFLQHPQETLSRDQLLDEARGRSSQVFDRSIDTLVSRLRKKLRNTTDVPEMIKTVWGGGYCLIAEVTTE